MDGDFSAGVWCSGAEGRGDAGKVSVGHKTHFDTVALQVHHGQMRQRREGNGHRGQPVVGHLELFERAEEAHARRQLRDAVFQNVEFAQVGQQHDVVGEGRQVVVRQAQALQWGGEELGGGANGESVSVQLSA